MLQQTQMERGVSYFNRWIELFPTLFDVAKASEEEILHAWEGLGYYRRARYLHETAKKICAEHNGIIPNNKEILQSFKGLGDYTIAAILGIAYENDIVTIDANVERVFSRLFCIEGDTKKNPAKSKIKELAYAHLPLGKARLYNQSLMELGALICKKKALCELCPLREFCQAYSNNLQEKFPSPKTKQKLISEEWVELLFMSNDKKIIISQRDHTSHWGGLFQFYPIEITNKNREKTIEAELDSLGISNKDIMIEEKTKIDYSYTNHRNRLNFYIIYTQFSSNQLCEIFKNQTIEINELANFAFPAPYRKAINLIF